MKKRFLTFFPKCESVHLTKDVGMIPFFLYKYCNYDAYIASYNINFDYATKEVEGVKFLKIENKFRNSKWNCAWFMLKNARRFDVLQLYQEGYVENLIASEIYRWCNPKGKVYIKLDADEKLLDRYDFWRKGIRGYIYRRHLRKADVISAETMNAVKKFSENWKIKVDYVPNGFYCQEQGKCDYSQKENIILTVGRLGVEPKNTEELIKGFSVFANNNPDWKLLLVGPAADSLMSWYGEFAKDNMVCSDRIIFVGEVLDRQELYAYYSKAKIFCLTSKYESFALVFLEAIARGCYIVSTPVGAYKDATKNGEFGSWYQSGNEKDLAEKLERVCKDENLLRRTTDEVQKFAYQYFYWPEVVKKIDVLLSENK